VHGPNPAHGCGPTGVKAYGAGCTGLLAFPAPGQSGLVCSVRPKAEAARPGPLARRPARLAPGARSWARAPQLSGGCAG
jgi:hypothetical protein